MKNHLQTWSVWLVALGVVAALGVPVALQAKANKPVAKKSTKPPAKSPTKTGSEKAAKTKKPTDKPAAKAPAAPDAAATPVVDPAVAGRKVFVDRLCASCHTLKAAGMDRKPPPPGPDLSGLAQRMDAAALEAWLRRGQARAGKTHPIRFLGSEAEWQQLSAWLASLK
jgi:cytochrome c2